MKLKLFHYTRHGFVSDEFDYEPVWREDSTIIAARDKKEAGDLLPLYFDPNHPKAYVTVRQTAIKRGVLKFR